MERKKVRMCVYEINFQDYHHKLIVENKRENLCVDMSIDIRLLSTKLKRQFSFRRSFGNVPKAYTYFNWLVLGLSVHLLGK